MKKSLAVACIWLWLAWAPDVGAAGINWLSYDEGMSIGKGGGKKIFLHFYADWCSYCKKMEKETFANRAIIAYLNRNFISIKVNTDKESKTAEHYRVRGLPDTYIISQEGQKVHVRPGYISADELLPKLKFMHTDSYKKMTYATFLKSEKK